MVLGDDKSHGTSRVMRVGPRSGLETTIVPSNAASRRITPAMPVPRPGSAPPRPSSPTTTRSTPSPWLDADPGVLGAGVLADIGQALGDREVDRRLHRSGRPAARSASIGPAAPCRAPAPRPLRPARGRRAPAGGCPAPPSRSSPSAAPVVTRASETSRRAPSGSRSKSSSASPRLIDKRDQPGLRAVVQVALDPPQLGRGVVDRLGPRVSVSCDDPLLELLGDAGGEQPPVDGGARPHERGAPYHQTGHGHDQERAAGRRSARPRIPTVTRPAPDAGRARSSGRSRQLAAGSSDPRSGGDVRRRRVAAEQSAAIAGAVGDPPGAGIATGRNSGPTHTIISTPPTTRNDEQHEEQAPADTIWRRRSR